jgi:amino acid transporter
MAEPTREGLVRVIRRWDLVALAINAIIGAGIFGLPSEVFGRIGVYSLLAFLVCAVLVSLIVICFAEVGSRFSDTGGPYLYAREAFGPLAGFEVGWLMWIARLTAFAANCNLLVAYSTYFVPAMEAPGGRAAAICLVVGALTAVNLVGVRNAALVSNTLTVAKLVPLALFVAIGGFLVDAGAYSAGPAPSIGEFSVAVLLLVYAFSGFEMVLIASGEAHDPRRDSPRALLIAMAVVAAFYLSIQFVAIGTLPTLAASPRPLADAGARFLGPFGGALMTAGALVSILGNLNAIVLVAPRLPFAMAERRELPGILSATNLRFHTPHWAILATSAALLVLTLSGTFVYALTISVIARLLSYGATCLALVVLRRRSDAPAALFVAPAGMTVAGLALVLVLWLLSNVTAGQARDAALAAAAGLPLYWASRSARRRQARQAATTLTP